MILPTDSLESLRPPSNDERMAQWASKYFSAGYHHERPEQDTHTEPADTGGN